MKKKNGNIYIIKHKNETNVILFGTKSLIYNNSVIQNHTVHKRDFKFFLNWKHCEATATSLPKRPRNRWQFKRQWFKIQNIVFVFIYHMTIEVGYSRRCYAATSTFTSSKESWNSCFTSSKADWTSTFTSRKDGWTLTFTSSRRD